MLNPWANHKPRTQWERDHYNAGVADGETEAKPAAKPEAKPEARPAARPEARPRHCCASCLRAAWSTTDAERHQIQACEDTQQLERWIERALSAQSVAEVLAE